MISSLFIYLLTYVFIYLFIENCAGLDGESASNSRGSRVHVAADYTEVTVHSPSATMYVLTDLEKFTRYEVRVQPFYGTVNSAESNLLRFQTAPDSK